MFRLYFAVEQRVVHGSLDMPVGRAVTLEEFTEVFPDASGYLLALGRMHGNSTAVAVLSRLGYFDRGLTAQMATFHLCTLGLMNRFTAPEFENAGRAAIDNAVRDHKLGHYCGHPLRVFQAAIRG